MPARTRALTLALTTGLSLVAASVSAAPHGPPPPTPATIDIPFQEFTLGNGLRVIVHTDRKVPVVAVNVWYHVGSKDEPAGRSGFAHLFEHLMFQGSENYKGEYFDPFEKAGATNQNGTTSRDRTNYFENVPTTALDMALWMESDRMGHLLGAIDQATLDEQRGVVQNEKRQGENQPYGLSYQHLTAASYPEGHPYHHTVIGSMTDLNVATLDDVKHWFQSWYGPNNAVLVLSGDIDVATAKAKVARYFGDIPATATAPKLAPQIAPRTTSTREAFTDEVPQTRLIKAWNTPPYGTAAATRLELFAAILGGLPSSRLERRLVHADKTVDHVNVFVWQAELGDMFIVSADVKQGADPAVVEKAIDEELQRLIADGPSADELARARTAMRAAFIRGIERLGGFGGKADVLAECAVFTGKPGCFRDDLRTMAGTTPAQLAAVGKRWLRQGDHVLRISPGARTPTIEPPAITDLPPTHVAAPDRRWSVVKTDVDRSKGVPSVDAFPALVFPTLQHATLSNGMQVVLAERPGVPLVEMTLDVKGAGFASDPASARGTAAFAMGMLDEGAADLDALAFADRIATLGATLNARATIDTGTVTLSALKENLDPSLALFADVLVRPRFDAKELERVRAQWIADIQQEKARPLELARRLIGPLLYGAGHPYATARSGNGSEASIAALTREQLTAWVAARLRPDTATLVVVGDTTLAEIQPKLEAALGRWKAPASAAPTGAIPPVALPTQPRVFLIDQPGALQANIVVAQLVPSSTDAGALDFEMTNEVLGGEFSSRLNMNLRENKHWSYGSYAGISDALGQRKWAATAPVQIDKTIEALRELRKEITQYATGKAPARPDELARIQANEVRSLPGSFETDGAVAAEIVDMLRYGRPDDWTSQRATKIQALTPAAINAAAAAIKPSALTWIIVGDLQKIEPGVRALKLGDVKVVDGDGKILR